MQAPFDLAKAHRWFAVEFNNAAWPLVEAEQRTADESERMLHLAHAASLHWDAVGTPINRQRADQLLAHAYAAAGMGARAMYYADRCQFFSEGNPDEQTPFDRAGACVGMAQALIADGREAESASWRENALMLIRELPEEEDRQVLERLLALRPRNS